MITSSNPKHLKLGQQLDQLTLRMAHSKRIIDSTTLAFKSALLIYGTFRDAGGSIEVDLDHVVATKLMLGNFQECLTHAQTEFDEYVEEFKKLDAVLHKLEKKSRPKPSTEPPTPPPAPTTFEFPNAPPELPQSESEEQRFNHPR